MVEPKVSSTVGHLHGGQQTGATLVKQISPTERRHLGLKPLEQVDQLGFRGSFAARVSRTYLRCDIRRATDLGSDTGDPAMICFRWPGGSGRSTCRGGGLVSQGREKPNARSQASFDW